jgi:hypothetical protein
MEGEGTMEGENIHFLKDKNNEKGCPFLNSLFIS